MHEWNKKINIKKMLFVCEWDNKNDFLLDSLKAKYKVWGGVYVIFNHNLQRVYIGSSKSLSVRWKEHLRKGLITKTGKLPLYNRDIEINQKYEVFVFKESLVPTEKVISRQLKENENKYLYLLKLKYENYDFYNKNSPSRQCLVVDLRTMSCTSMPMSIKLAAKKYKRSCIGVAHSLKGMRISKLCPYIFVRSDGWFKPIIYKVLVLRNHSLGITQRYISSNEIIADTGISKSRIYYALKEKKRIMKKKYSIKWGYIVVCCGIVIVI